MTAKMLNNALLVIIVQVRAAHQLSVPKVFILIVSFWTHVLNVQLVATVQPKITQVDTKTVLTTKTAVLYRVLPVIFVQKGRKVYLKSVQWARTTQTLVPESDRIVCHAQLDISAQAKVRPKLTQGMRLNLVTFPLRAVPTKIQMILERFVVRVQKATTAKKELSIQFHVMKVRLATLELAHANNVAIVHKYRARYVCLQVLTNCHSKE